MPDVRAGWRLTTAAVIDTLGAGVFLPISFLFLVQASGVSLAGVGVAITVATLSSLVVVPAVGGMVDRLGARRMVVLSNVLASVGTLLYLFARSPLTIFAAVFVVMVADRLYWSAWPTYISVVARPSELDSWFSLIHALKSGSFGLGGLLATLALLSDSNTAFFVLLLIRVVMSLAGAALLWTPSQRERERVHERENGRPTAHDGKRGAGPWRVVLRDRTYLGLVGAQALVSLAWVVPTAVMPIYAVRLLELDAWLPAALFTLNSLMIFGTQTRVTEMVQDVARSMVLISGAALVAVSIVMMASAAWLASPGRLTMIVLGMAVFTMGEMLCLPTANALAAAMAPAPVRGRYLALFQMTWAMTWGLGPGLVGLLLERHTVILWVVLGGCVALGALLQRRLTPRLAVRGLRAAPPPMQPAEQT